MQTSTYTAFTQTIYSRYSSSWLVPTTFCSFITFPSPGIPVLLATPTLYLFYYLRSELCIEVNFRGCNRGSWHDTVLFHYRKFLLLWNLLRTDVIQFSFFWTLQKLPSIMLTTSIHFKPSLICNVRLRNVPGSFRTISKEPTQLVTSKTYYGRDKGALVSNLFDRKEVVFAVTMITIKDRLPRRRPSKL